MKSIINYQTLDGKTFINYDDAKQHERDLVGQSIEKLCAAAGVPVHFSRKQALIDTVEGGNYAELKNAVQRLLNAIEWAETDPETAAYDNC